ncbi:MAG TPA: TetR-like C-terminal domain-containing protein [Ktedonobacteraceae bacterium]
MQGQLRHDLDIELVVDLLISPIFSRRVMSGGSLPDQLPEQLIATVWKAL